MNLRKLAVAALIAAISPALNPAMADGDHRHEHTDGKAKGEHSHSDADHGHQHGPMHGGQFVEVQGHHGVEMVAGADALVFHLTEDGLPMKLNGTTFKAVVQSEAGTKVLPLKADGAKLSAALDAPLPSGAKVALSGKDDHGHTIQARFVKD